MLHHFYTLENGHYALYFGNVYCYFTFDSNTVVICHFQYLFRTNYYIVVRLYQNYSQIGKNLLKQIDKDNDHNYRPYYLHHYFRLEKHVLFKELAIEFCIYSPHEWNLWKTCWKSTDSYVYWEPIKLVQKTSLKKY